MVFVVNIFFRILIGMVGMEFYYVFIIFDLRVYRKVGCLGFFGGEGDREGSGFEVLVS